MNTIRNITLMLLATLFVGVVQAQDPDVQAVLNDPAKQAQFIDALVKDHQMMKDFSQTMLNNDHALGMVIDEALIRAENDTLVAQDLAEMVGRYHSVSLIVVDHIITVAENDPVMNHQICQDLMEHEKMKADMCKQMKAEEMKGGSGCCSMSGKKGK